MKIAFDATTLQGRQTGIGYYTEHLLTHLIALAPQHEFLLISNSTIEMSQDVRATVQRAGTRFPLRAVWMQCLAPVTLLRWKPALAHFTNSIMPVACPVGAVVTVHDMSLWLYPNHHPWRRRLTRPLIQASLKKARAVITVSENSRREIVRLAGVPRAKVHVVHEAAAPQFRPISEASRLDLVRTRYSLPGQFLLFVGAIEPRKNLPRLLSAFGRLKDQGLPHQLVLAGPPFWGYREVVEKIRSLELEEHVSLLGYVRFDDLPALYNLAEAFVFPSLHEGFGLPVVEAMACGLPVLTSRNSALVEIAGDAAELVDPLDVASIEQGLSRLLEAGELPRRREASLQRAAHYSWTRAAQQTLQIYESVAHRKRVTA